MAGFNPALAEAEPSLATDLLPGTSRRPRAGRGQRLYDRLVAPLIPTLSAIVVLGVVWELVGQLLQFPWFPPVSKVLVTLVKLIDQGVIGTNVLASLRSLAIGYASSLTFGLVVGTLLGRYRWFEHLFGIYVQLLVFAPSIIFAPIFFTIFGLSDITRIAVVFLYSAFIIAVNTATAVRYVDRTLVEMATVFGASERKMVMKVILPGALPLMMAGVRLGAGRAVKGMINGEAFIALVGLGALVETYGGQFAADKVLAILIIVVGIAVIVASLVQAIDRRLTSWSTM